MFAAVIEGNSAIIWLPYKTHPNGSLRLNPILKWIPKQGFFSYESGNRVKGLNHYQFKRNLSDITIRVATTAVSINLDLMRT